MQKDFWCTKFCDSIINITPLFPIRWSYDFGVVMKGMEYVWKITGDKKYFDFIKQNMDQFVDFAGFVGHYQPEEYNIDHVNNGKLLFPLFNETKDQRYKKAAHQLRQQMLRQPRTLAGGFWHKFIYPHQMWLDGIYMGSAFLSQFAGNFEEKSIFDDVAHQVTLIYSCTLDKKTGLLYHGYDESRGMKWADDVTGCSPNFWGRAIGWYLVAIVDILDDFPKDHPKRKDIIDILKKTVDAVIKVQDPHSKLWYQVLDQGDREGNYIESSASSMFICAMAKGSRKGYLDASIASVAEEAFQKIIESKVYCDNDGNYHLKDVCSVSGLGNNPYRDGSFEYYMSEPVIEDDYKGVGALIQAAAQIEGGDKLG